MTPDEPLESLKSSIPKVLLEGVEKAGAHIRAELAIVQRLAEAAGISLQELLLYLVSEQLGELRREVASAVARGIAVQVAGQIFERREEEPPPEGEEWKRPPQNLDEEDGA